MSSEIQNTEPVAKDATVTEPVTENVQVEQAIPTIPESSETPEVPEPEEPEEVPDSEDLPEIVPDRVYEISELASLPDKSIVWVRNADLKEKPEINSRFLVDKDGNKVLDENGKPVIEYNEAKIEEYRRKSDYITNNSLVTSNEFGEKLDGNQRSRARSLKGRTYIRILLRITHGDIKLEKMISAKANLHGMPTSDTQKSILTLDLWQSGTEDGDIINNVGISQSYLNKLTKPKRDEQTNQEKERIRQLWFRGETNTSIAKLLDTASPEEKASPDYKVPKKVLSKVDRKVSEILRIALESEMGKFLDYSQGGSPLLVTTCWEFDSVSVLPPEAFENILNYISDPTDLVFDPFGSNGTTSDICEKRSRRYWASDKTPVRADIREYDISGGLPKGLPMPKVVFLNPLDAGCNLDINPEIIGNVAREIKKKWDDNLGYLVFVTPIEGNLDGKTKSVSQACYEQISKYLNETDTITVYASNLNTWEVAAAKVNRKFFVNSRRIYVFSNGKDKPLQKKSEQEAPAESVPEPEVSPDPEVATPGPEVSPAERPIPEPEVSPDPEVATPGPEVSPAERPVPEPEVSPDPEVATPGPEVSPAERPVPEPEVSPEPEATASAAEPTATATDSGINKSDVPEKIKPKKSEMKEDELHEHLQRVGEIRANKNGKNKIKPKFDEDW
jgi:hypothetical protein